MGQKEGLERGQKEGLERRAKRRARKGKKEELERGKKEELERGHKYCKIDVFSFERLREENGISKVKKRVGFF